MHARIRPGTSGFPDANQALATLIELTVGESCIEGLGYSAGTVTGGLSIDLLVPRIYKIDDTAANKVGPTPVAVYS